MRTLYVGTSTPRRVLWCQNTEQPSTCAAVRQCSAVERHTDVHNLKVIMMRLSSSASDSTQRSAVCPASTGVAKASLAECVAPSLARRDVRPTVHNAAAAVLNPRLGTRTPPTYGFSTVCHSAYHPSRDGDEVLYTQSPHCSPECLHHNLCVGMRRTRHTNRNSESRLYHPLMSIRPS